MNRSVALLAACAARRAVLGAPGPALRSLAAVPSGPFRRAFSSEPFSEEVSKDDIFKSRTRRDNRLRYFVVKEKAGAALSLLERSLFQVPVVDGRGDTRTLKLPPASVCSKVVHQSAGDPSLTARTADVAETLLLRGVLLEPRALSALCAALARAGEFGRALEAAEAWRRAEAAAAAAGGPGGDLSIGGNALGSGDGTPASVELADTLLRLLHAAARADRPRAALEALARLEHLGVPPGEREAVVLAACFARAGQTLAARRMAAWAAEHGLELTRALFAAALATPNAGVVSATAGSSAAGDHVRSVLDDAEASGVRADAVLLSSAARRLGAGGTAADLRWVLAEARARGLQADPAFVRSLFSSSASIGATQVALDLLADIAPELLAGAAPGAAADAPSLPLPALCSLLAALAATYPARPAHLIEAATVASRAWGRVVAQCRPEAAAGGTGSAARTSTSLATRAIPPTARADAVLALGLGGDVEGALAAIDAGDAGAGSAWALRHALRRALRAGGPGAPLAEALARRLVVGPPGVLSARDALAVLAVRAAGVPEERSGAGGLAEPLAATWLLDMPEEDPLVVSPARSGAVGVTIAPARGLGGGGPATPGRSAARPREAGGSGSAPPREHGTGGVPSALRQLGPVLLGTRGSGDASRAAKKLLGKDSAPPPGDVVAALVGALAVQGRAVSALRTHSDAVRAAHQVHRPPPRGEALARTLLFAALNVHEPEARAEAVRAAVEMSSPRKGADPPWWDARTREAASEALGIV